MNRRDLLRNLALISAGVSLFPACDFSTVPVYSNIPIDKPKWLTLNRISRAILPLKNIPEQRELSTTHFVLTVVNNCYKSEDIKDYLAGFDEFLTLAKSKLKVEKFANLEDIQVTQFIKEVAEIEEMSEPLELFFGTTKGLTVQHYTSSEDFLKNKMEWQFAPGKYEGCAQV